MNGVEDTVRHMENSFTSLLERRAERSRASGGHVVLIYSLFLTGYSRL